MGDTYRTGVEGLGWQETAELAIEAEAKFKELLEQPEPEVEGELTALVEYIGENLERAHKYMAALFNAEGDSHEETLLQVLKTDYALARLCALMDVGDEEVMKWIDAQNVEDRAGILATDGVLGALDHVGCEKDYIEALYYEQDDDTREAIRAAEGAGYALEGISHAAPLPT